jgi:hypothetical protein
MAAALGRQLGILTAQLADTPPERTDLPLDESIGVGFVAWAKQLTAGAEAGSGTDRGGGNSEGSEQWGGGWKSREGGLQAVAEAFGAHNSAGARQAGMERALEEMDDDYRLPRNHQPQGYIDMSRCD